MKRIILVVALASFMGHTESPCERILLSEAIDNSEFQIDESHFLIDRLQAARSRMENDGLFRFVGEDFLSKSTPHSPWDINEKKRQELRENWETLALLDWFYRNLDDPLLKLRVLDCIDVHLSYIGMAYKMDEISDDMIPYPMRPGFDINAFILDRDIRKAAWESDPDSKLEKIWDEVFVKDVGEKRKRLLFATLKKIIAAPDEHFPTWEFTANFRAVGDLSDLPILEALALESPLWMKHLLLRRTQVIKRDDIDRKWRLSRFRTLIGKFINQDLQRTTPLDTPASDSILITTFDALIGQYSVDDYPSAEIIFSEIEVHHDFTIWEDNPFLVQRAFQKKRPILATLFAEKYKASPSKHEVAILLNAVKSRLGSADQNNPHLSWRSDYLFFAIFGDLREAKEYFTVLRNRLGLDYTDGNLDEVMTVLWERESQQF